MALLPEGKYKCYITDQGVSVKGDKPSLFIEFDVIARKEKGEWVAASRPHYKRLVKSLAEKALPYTIADVERMLGERLLSFSRFDPRHPQAQSLIGRELEMRCEHRMYKEQQQEDWRVMGGDTASAEHLTALDAMLERRRNAAIVDTSDLPGDFPADPLPDEDLFA